MATCYCQLGGPWCRLPSPTCWVPKLAPPAPPCCLPLLRGLSCRQPQATLHPPPHPTGKLSVPTFPNCCWALHLLPLLFLGIIQCSPLRHHPFFCVPLFPLALFLHCKALGAGTTFLFCPVLWGSAHSRVSWGRSPLYSYAWTHTYTLWQYKLLLFINIISTRI